MMIAEFQCPKCKIIIEEYFSTFNHIPKEGIDCKKCKVKMPKIMSVPRMGRSGDVPGYEKENQGQLTLGKAFDQHASKWF